MYAVTSTLMMSPSSITVESGMPWQITSLSDGAARLREALVAQRRRVGAVVAEELVHHPVDLVGGHARLAVLAGQHGRLRGQPAGNAHLLDRLRGLDVRSGPARRLLLPMYSGRGICAGT